MSSEALTIQVAEGVQMRLNVWLEQKSQAACEQLGLQLEVMPSRRAMPALLAGPAA